MLLTFANDGEDIAETNFFDSEFGVRGLLYLCWNAGAARLLVPDQLAPLVADMRGAQYVIISAGQLNGEAGVELLFEDDSDAPLSIHMLINQCDRDLGATVADPQRVFPFAVWTRAGKQVATTARLRAVATLPYLKPWGR